LPAEPTHDFVSRGGLKLDHALTALGVDVTGLAAADFGCSTGGFTDVLLRRGVKHVTAIDTGYGVLDYRLRTDQRVTVRERTNAMHVELAEPVDLIVIDAGWTRQAKILPAAHRNLKADGRVVTLVKPHYEAEKASLVDGVLPDAARAAVLEQTRHNVAAAGFEVLGETDSPIPGSKGKTRGNVEALWLLRPTDHLNR
jgi:23S rRNA (cytidine1920-2'-O)/16S rRNA (cytidine1409-2'-O)-methyltransferase